MHAYTGGLGKEAGEKGTRVGASHAQRPPGLCVPLKPTSHTLQTRQVCQKRPSLKQKRPSVEVKRPANTDTPSSRAQAKNKGGLHATTIYCSSRSLFPLFKVSFDTPSSRARPRTRGGLPATTNSRSLPTQVS
jgi:hypothetical protein